MEIHIQIELEDDGFPTAAELQLRHDLEDWIIGNQIGEIVDVGAGMGMMDIYVEVDDPSWAMEVLQTYLEEQKIENITRMQLL